jgi:hypothetical protein
MFRALRRTEHALTRDPVQRWAGGCSHMSPQRARMIEDMILAGFVPTLEIGTIDRAKQVLRIVGNGNKNRMVLLPPPVVDELGRLWLTHHNRRWSFPTIAVTRGSITVCCREFSAPLRVRQASGALRRGRT